MGRSGSVWEMGRSGSVWETSLVSLLPNSPSSLSSRLMLPLVILEVAEGPSGCRELEVEVDSDLVIGPWTSGSV